MNPQESEKVVTKTIEVACDVAHAFQVWTQQIDQWWPKSHSMSGDPRTTVLMEGEVGGRVYERTSNGDEREWGRILVWEPPHAVAYTWYLGTSQEIPSRVDIRFVPLADGRTRIELTHRGPELIGELWWSRVEKYSGAWEMILPKFAAGCLVGGA